MAGEKIPYYDYQLTVAEIARLEGLVPVTLRRYYYQIGDIYIAVEKCAEKTRGPIQKIKYENDEMLPISVIAKRENLAIQTLINSYKKTGNIFESVRICKEEQKARQERQKEIDQTEKEEYYGKRLRLREIAKIEEINADDLRMSFKQVKDAYKAVFMTKYQKQKEKVVNYPGLSVNLHDLSLLIGVKYTDLINLLNEGMTIAEIKEKYANQYAGENNQLPRGKTLLEFCINKKVKFAFMYRAVNTYGKTLERAVEEYRKQERKIPTSWIFEKYNDEFQKLHLTAPQLVLIFKLLSEKYLSLEEALEKCVTRRNALKNGISEEWGEILYSMSKTRELLGQEFHTEIKMNEDETRFLEECEAELRPQGCTNPISSVKAEQDDDITHD